MKLLQGLALLLIFEYFHVCMADLKTKQSSFVLGSRVRERRDARRAKLEFINRIGRNVNLYYMHTGRHARVYFLRLRPNEDNHIDSWIGTTWLAYDEDQQPMLLNNKYNFLVHPDYLKTNDRIEILISLPKSLKVDQPARAPQRIPDRYLELYVVADYTFYSYYKKNGGDAEKYVRAMMTAVNQIFQDKSLGVKLHVIVKKIVITTKNIRELQIPSDKPRQAVKKACNYLYERKHYEQSKFDFGVVLTRNSFGYSGFTPLYRMCEDYKSCTLIRDHGLHSAFIVAHEIGHSIGLSHDGDYNGCRNDAPLGSIMSPTVYSRFDRYFWSNCTKTQIRQNIRYFSCLEDKPSEFQEKVEPPGESFNIDDHCTHYMGRGHTNCLGIRTPDQHCRFIFCRIPDKQRNLCKYWNLPPADGTQCAEGKWCIKGQCLPKGMFQPAPIDGGWSRWTSWSACSHTCGVGVRVRKRLCDNPRPEYDGQDCKGPEKDWDPCSYERCSTTLTFTDKRNDLCYSSHGEHSRWFHHTEAMQRVQNLAVNCTFENGLCGWQNSKIEKEQWTINNGTTPTKKTGPSFDHTYRNNTGSYLYLESSHPVRSGDKVSLISEFILAPKTCLRFYYHMFGDRLGTLNVKLKLRNGKLETLWTKAKNQLDYWRMGHTSIDQDMGYQIIFEAVRGTSYMSDIAIDDITLSFGSCEQDLDHSIDMNPCLLSCYNEEEQKFYLDKKIPNGERCHDAEHNICVYGKCQTVGCDVKINSTKQYDKCNRCDGNDTACYYSNGVLSVKPREPVTTFLRVPKGATNCVIRKLTPTSGKTAVQPGNERRSYYYAAQPEFYTWNYFTAAGTTGRYQLFDNKTESIFLDGTLEEETFIKLLFPDETFNKSLDIKIEFSYHVTRDGRSETFVPLITDYSKCTTVCDGGTQTALYSCVNMRVNKTVPMQKCLRSNVELLPLKRDCNTEPCVVRYVTNVSKWSECSACGTVGFRTRIVTCIQTKSGEPSVQVDLKFCNMESNKERAKCFKYCPTSKTRPCIERSPSCGRMLRKGYCKYNSVQSLCCQTCRKFIIPKK